MQTANMLVAPAPVGLAPICLGLAKFPLDCGLMCCNNHLGNAGYPWILTDTCTYLVTFVRVEASVLWFTAVHSRAHSIEGVGSYHKMQVCGPSR